MPLNIRGTLYTIPKEGNEPGPTGREIIEIEEHFDLDGLRLLEVLGDSEPSKLPRYSRAKAIYAMAWICMSRAGEILSISDLLNEYSIDEFAAAEEDEDESKKELASEEAVQEVE